MSEFHSMKQRTIIEALTEAERHAAGNRREIERSRYAGCFSCCATFNVTQIVDWNDEWTTSEKRNEANRWTAKCPRCGQATVIALA